MAILPTHQFYPRTTRLQFLRYNSSCPFNKQQSFSATNRIFNPDTSLGKTHQKISNFAPKNKANRWGFPRPKSRGMSLSGCSWLDNWNEAYKQNKLKKPQIVLNYRNNGDYSDSDGEGSVSGSSMEKIVEKLKKFGYIDDVSDGDNKAERVIEKGSIEDIFRVEEGMLPNVRGGFSEKYPLGNESDGKIRFPWEKQLNEEDEEMYSVRKKSNTHLAEVTLPESELRRLRNLVLRIKRKLRIKGAGVTQEIVETIHKRWKSAEVVRLKIEGAPALNMKRTHETLERKTGGLVIWRSGTAVALYRGVSYEPPEQQKKRTFNKNEIPHNSSTTVDQKSIKKPSESGLREDDLRVPQADHLSTPEENKNIETRVEVKYEDEVDRMLDGLGPRYLDWPGSEPLPVDADLLPGIIHGYKPPFRILPYGVRPTLGIKEATDLRWLARTLPPHFALGRSRQHQGLASAMIKLWERCLIAKIAIKRGVQLTTSERMAEDIKKLTGGILLSRNKDFLVFYRGKDFLSREVSEALLEKERLVKALQDDEEQARLRAAMLVTQSVHLTDSSRTAGTLGETLDADAKWGKTLDDKDKEKVMKEAEILRHANLVRKLEEKLSFAQRKLKRAERALSKVELSLKPSNQPADPNSITDEERFMFRKLGLRMKAFLLMGRRGVFDGTVENMHLHWKYRELVKIIVKANNLDQVRSIALALEVESGGVLVSVDKVSKGYAVIVFRGKEYQRPRMLRPKNLLTKRKALARSIEIQRRESILKHIATVQKSVNKLKAELEQMASVKDHGDEELYDKLDSAYPSDEDEESEQEGEDEVPGGYDSDEDLVNGSESFGGNSHLETNFPYDDIEDEIETDIEDESETELVER